MHDGESITQFLYHMSLTLVDNIHSFFSKFWYWLIQIYRGGYKTVQLFWYTHFTRFFHSAIKIHSNYFIQF